MSLAGRSRWILLGILVALIAAVWWSRQRPHHYSVAYVSGHGATLWDTTAQVRQPVDTLHFGDRVMMERHAGNQVQVRTDAGKQGWVDVRLLMDAALWGKREALLSKARAMAIQARGHTRTISNVHIGPGREAPRIYQFGRNVPVAVLARSVLAAPEPANASSGVAEAKKQEDWLLVMRTQPTAAEFAAVPRSSPVSTAGASASGGGGGEIPVAGWVLGRFVTLDPPAPIPDYASSAGMRVVAWEVLDEVPSPAGERPQYLVAGTREGEGRPCDFTMLRVYTWSKSRQRYETAFIENGLCGALPLRMLKTPRGIEFRFAEAGGSRAERVYRMRGTIVRQLHEGAQKGAKQR